MKFVMMAGLPRSGSTLLQNILAQNPRFHATPTSNTAQVVDGIRKSWLSHVPSWVVDEETDQQQMLGTLSGCVKGKYLYTCRDVIFDKNREWPHLYEIMNEALGDAKIVMCVRPLVDVCASMEKVYRKNIAYYGKLISQEEVPTESTYERVKYWTGKGLVAGAYNVLNSFIGRGLQNRAYWVHYDELTKNPHRVIGGLYNYIGEEWDGMIHPIQNLIREDDRYHGYRFLHQVREGQILHEESQAIRILGEQCVTEITAIEPTWPRMVM